MCFTSSNIKNFSDWNWDGDVIIRQSIVPSGRAVIGVNTQKSYDIDVREFLTISRNAVMERVLQRDIPLYLEQEGGSIAYFESRKEGSFDYRATVITRFVADNIAYQAGKKHDPWQFPEETLALKAGDCEDRAFLLASLLLTAGVSTFNVRVAFGQVWIGETPHDHIWVVYKNERGHWMLIEPLQLGKALADEHLAEPCALGQEPPPVRYVPAFLFNDSHLWAMRQSQSEEVDLQRFLRRDWQRLDPKFAGEVHQSILHQAIAAVPNVPSWVLKELDKNFVRLFLFGPIIDMPDLKIASYNPLEHFDNGYINESWEKVAQNLALFKQDNRNNLKAFSRAAHAIADFYAHTSYVHFANLVAPAGADGHAVLFDPANPPPFNTQPSYKKLSTFDLTAAKFSVNTSLWTQSKDKIAQRWDKQLISGRYAQPNDTQSGLTNFVTEGATTIPENLRKAAGFADRGSLPHHNQIAVDDEAMSNQHCLYNSAGDINSRMLYANQFKWRKNSAVLHVRKVFVDNFNAGNT